jgi:hypothetical protein
VGGAPVLGQAIGLPVSTCPMAAEAPRSRAARRAVASLADKLQLPFLRTVVIGAKGTDDAYHDWSRTREMDEAGAILVRPDGYVARRHSDAVWDDNEATHLLQQAVTSILDRHDDRGRS